MSTPMLTPKQKEILDFITSFRAERGYAPSQWEIAKHFGFKSLGTVQNYLVRLEREGALQKTWNARRGVQVLHNHGGSSQQSSAVPVPLVGRVAAGRPVEAIRSDESLDVPASMLGAGAQHFVLKVKGDSMIEDGILDGDYVIVRKQETAVNGQTVVALIGGNEATIKRFQKRGDRIELIAANPNYKPIVVEGGEFKIEGILVGVLRKCSF
jgi:repressor LexA